MAAAQAIVGGLMFSSAAFKIIERKELPEILLREIEEVSENLGFRGTENSQLGEVPPAVE